jgi:hypothetical protein
MLAILLPTSGELAMFWDFRKNARLHADVARLASPPIMARIPQGLIVGTQAVRSGAINSVTRCYPGKDTFAMDDHMHLWAVVPSRGTTLVLPFTDASGVTVERVAHESRLVLSGSLLITYLTTWAVWGRRPDDGGKFIVDSREIAELRGFSEASSRKLMHDFRRSIDELTRIGVKSTREIKAAVAEPLINRLDVMGRGSYYRHAPILVDTLRLKGGEPGGFAQVPFAACRLDAHAAPIAYGISAFWRREIVRSVLEPGAPGFWRSSLRKLADALDIYNPNEARKRGHAYWTKLAGDVARVTHDGCFGTVHITGEGPEASATLTPSPELAAAYAPLQDAREQARIRGERRADEIAVRRALPPKRKRAKP